MKAQQFPKLCDHGLFSNLKDVSKIAVAVSGGSDSLALLVLLADWAKSSDKSLYCFTVDHGLRVEAAEEAAFVGGICADLGCHHEILTWDDEKPETGIAKAAREARYRIMAKRCRALGIEHLILGHQFDDQAETLFMRLQRKQEGSRGLAGMAAKTGYWTDEGEGIMLHRPLLALSRDELKAFLKGRSIGWITDPSNENNAYERVRVRGALQDNPELCSQLVSYGGLSARFRAVTSRQAADFIDQHVSMIRFGGVKLNQKELKALPEEICVLVLQVLLSAFGGRDYLPSFSDVLRLVGSNAGKTLSRVHVQSSGSHWYLNREVRHLPEPVSWDGRSIIWDRRFLIKATNVSGDLVCGDALKDEERMAVLSICDQPFNQFERAAFLSAPFVKVVHKDGFDFLSCLNVKANDALSVRPLHGGLERFCGDFDRPLKGALGRLLTKPVHFE